jgi:coenzyme F420-0:L-glutamate ligase/coenzyme F420-1:gamma-L-glutamate ligase
MSLEIRGIEGLPEVGAGDDLAALIAGAADLRDGDVVVVAQKVVSKAEGALVPLVPGEDAAAARRRLAVEHARRVVVDAPFTVVTETPHGLVCANGGIDASNVPEGFVLLLPDDPDASARRIREGLRERTGATVAVVVSDTFGRPWRMGQTDVAIGAAGIAVLRDERGGRDRQGRVLEVTEAAVADELAGAADLVRRKGGGVPVVVVRGLRYDAGPDRGAAALIRPAADDLFRRGRGALADALAGLRPQATVPSVAPRPGIVPVGTAQAPAGPPGHDALLRVLGAADGLGRGRVIIDVLDGQPGSWPADRALRVLLSAGVDGIEGAVSVGAAAGGLVAAAIDLDLAVVARPVGEDEAAPRRPGAVLVELGVAGAAAEPQPTPRR